MRLGGLWWPSVDCGAESGRWGDRRSVAWKVWLGLDHGAVHAPGHMGNRRSTPARTCACACGDAVGCMIVVWAGALQGEVWLSWKQLKYQHQFLEAGCEPIGFDKASLQNVRLRISHGKGTQHQKAGQPYGCTQPRVLSRNC